LFTLKSSPAAAPDRMVANRCPSLSFSRSLPIVFAAASASDGGSKKASSAVVVSAPKIALSN
jgi:hypothetical protein